MAVGETIYALSSGVGRSALAVIRLSGPACGEVLRSLAGTVPEPRRFTVNRLRHPIGNEVLDEAVTVWLPGPRSFTGEDCAEFHVHGGVAVVRAVMEALSSFEGVRPAEPGEFTRRAFVNGKMDLVEVEGLADLLEAQTASQRRQAVRQMAGEVSAVFEVWREQLVMIRATIEAAVDFADEAGVAEAAMEGIDDRIRDLLSAIETALRASVASEVIREGARVVLAGRPNTGKSSLLNVLAGRDAAIVSCIPGTTRDSIEVMMDIGGFPVILADTAGVRDEVSDPVEAEGIRRSRKLSSGADLLIWVWSADVEGSATPVGGRLPDLVVQNKSDIVAPVTGLSRNDLSVSAMTGAGVGDLLARLQNVLLERYSGGDSAIIVSTRQKQVCERLIRLLNDALTTGLDVPELKAEHINRAMVEASRVTGRVDVEEWLGAIFSRFCIGK